MKRFEMRKLFGFLDIPEPDLLLRDYGRRAFPFLEQELREVPTGHALILSFEGVRVMDSSFAEEAVLELALGLTSNKYGDRMLILEQPSPATIDNLEGTIARRRVKVALLIRDGSEMRLIGHVEPNLHLTWQLISERGELTARDLANDFGLEINTASMRLHKLYEAKLIARHEEVTSSGRQHIYILPS
jgi:DNA-binding transcriptional ArsR family regulator